MIERRSIMSDKELQARVNPIFTTGKGTITSLAQAGNKDAIAILSKMDISDIQGVAAPPQIILKAFSIGLEARYEISNRMILKEKKKNIIDLPSGYTPRALFAAREGFNYIGFDLPVVADEIGGIVKDLLPDKYGKTVNYCGVDATNFESMSKALDTIDGEVCIVTDGLLGYFTEPELISVVENMKKILSKHGGCWITGDMTSMAVFPATFSVLFKDDPETVRAFADNTANKMSDASLGHNSLFDGGVEKAEGFLKKHGFSVEKISYADLLPELTSLGGDKEKLKALREAYRGIEMCVLTLDSEGESLVQEVKDKEFEAVLSLKDKDLSISLSGRLDTITAPDLLGKYENIPGKEALSSITVDAKDLQYISSAGLRVMMIMYKGLAGGKNFHMVNVSKDVKEILEVTGFSQFLI